MKLNLKTLFSTPLVSVLSVACGPLFNGKGLQRHGVEVSLKNGTPCFSVSREDRAMRREITVKLIDVWERDAPKGQQKIWESSPIFR